MGNNKFAVVVVVSNSESVVAGNKHWVPVDNSLAGNYHYGDDDVDAHDVHCPMQTAHH